MEILRLTHPVQNQYHEPHVIAIGFFDGVHLGHQQLLRRAKQITEQHQVLFTAMTFSPHPDENIKKESDREYLMTLTAKAEKLAAFGVDKLFVITFDQPFASLSRADFVREYILGIHAQHDVVGFDFTFGHKALGNTAYLQQASSKYPFDITVIPKRTYQMLKEIIQDGKVDGVPYYLGEHYRIDVEVVQQVDAGLIKIRTRSPYVMPRSGSYQVKVSDGRKGNYGILRCFSSVDQEDEWTLLGSVQGMASPLSITFLNPAPSVHTVSV